MFGVAAFEFAVMDAPEYVFNAVPSKAHVGDAALAKEFLKRFVAVAEGGGLSAPEVGDGVPDEQDFGVGLVVEANYFVVAAEPFVTLVASLANGRIAFHHYVFAEHFSHFF